MYANFLEHDIELPCIALVVSGGHTNIVYMDENHKFINMGGTLDDAVGESCDKSGQRYLDWGIQEDQL